MQTQPSPFAGIVAAAGAPRRDAPRVIIRRKHDSPGCYLDGRRVRRIVSITLEALAGQDVSTWALVRRHGISNATGKRFRSVLREFGLVTGKPKGGGRGKGRG